MDALETLNKLITTLKPHNNAPGRMEEARRHAYDARIELIIERQELSIWWRIKRIWRKMMWGSKA